MSNLLKPKNLPRSKKPDTLLRTIAAQKRFLDEGVSLSNDLSPDEIAYDARHPLYLGEWEASIPNVHEDIAQDDMDEPHLKRKHAILDAHPKVKELYGVEWKTKYVTLALVSLQLALAYAFGNGLLKDSSYFVLVGFSYFVGATVTGIFGVLIHECSHNLAFKAPVFNRVLGLICNIGIIFPIASSFRRYHLEHHAFQGVHGKDPDLPLEAEWKLVRGSRILKLLWVFCFPFLYVFRGVAMMKKPQTWEIINSIWTIVCDVLIWQFCGPRGFLYMFLSLWFGYGLHPAAAHFIQEHYTFSPGQETYSYYGSANTLFMNIGYHNEHHDFTQVPWSRLPTIRSIAPEFYDSIAYHTSWVRVLLEFIWKDEIGPQSRLGREFEDHKAGRATIISARKLKQC